MFLVENVSLAEAGDLYRHLKNHPTCVALKGFFHPFPCHLLLMLKEQELPFYLGQPMTYEQLASWFYATAPELALNLGTSKETNRLESQRFSDFFRVFTRSYLSRFCVVNDIDAVRLRGAEPAILLELKKPKESVESWEPYIDDCANYVYFHNISRKIGAEFRTIAYNLGQEAQVRLLLEVTCDELTRQASSVTYRTALLNPELALGDLHPDLLTKKASLRKRQRF